MTNKEAIKILQNDGCCQDCTFGGYPCKLVGCETHQALDLAIKALEERPQGDLISRKWLKEHKFTTQVCNGVEIEDVDVVGVATIDNALTVEVPENTVNCVLTMFGKCSYNETGCSDCEIKDKIRKALNARPQGEWITRHKLNSFGQDVVCFECNKCGEYKVPLYHLLITEPLKVCPNCGADMRGGRE